MPKEHKSRREVLDAINSLESLKGLLEQHDGHYEYELDLEVTVYGRNYRGKNVGPYVRLLTYEPGEAIITEGDWGGNTFFILVEGSADIFITAPNGEQVNVAEIHRGALFGEMSVLAGLPRNATIKAPATATAKLFEVQRPALRLLRKIEGFANELDKNYRANGRNAMIDELRLAAHLNAEAEESLNSIAQFKTFGKNHTLFRQGEPITRVYLVKQGWFRRRSGETQQLGSQAVDYLGKGYCFGLEGAVQNAAWPYTTTLMARAEILEIPVSQLRQVAALRDEFLRAAAPYAPPPLGSRVHLGKPVSDQQVRRDILRAQGEVISTGLVDGNNLLVMDMDLCVRCGNCSLACHKIHGQSRLLRRGIHVTRLSSARRGAVQSILSPEVCMHCADPECMTGCPTGAIARFGQGQVDIQSKICIGCSDCATQCPYDAITMVPARAKKGEDATRNFAWKVKDLLRLQPDPLPPAVEGTDDLLAVKCNLCNSTGMNPEGSKTAKYSCEDNCPTGALARVTPSRYFSEIEQIEGAYRVDQSHAIARNIHKSDPPKRLLHGVGIALTALSLAAAWAGFAKYGMGGSIFGVLNMRWLTGLVGLLGIAVVMTYPFRRQVYTKRRGALRYWLLVHTYAGTIAGLMILLHGGSDSGGWLTTLLMWSFDAVILTGLFGIFVYLAAPRMLTRIEGSPLLIDDLKQRRTELQREIASVASSISPALSDFIRRRVIPRFISGGYLLRQYLQREPLEKMLEAARLEYKPFTDTLTEAERNGLLKVVEAAATLRRVDALIYLHQLLKIWLPPHVLSTSLMLALMIVHIIQVVYYLAR